MTQHVEITTDILDPFEPVYTCPRCGQIIRRCDAFDPLRVMRAIVQHAHEHARDAEDRRLVFGESAP